MNTFLPPTSLPLSQDHTGNPNSSSSLNYHFSINDDQIYHFKIDDISYYNPNSRPLSFIYPPSYQDSSSSSFTTCFSAIEQTPVLPEMATAANTAQSSQIIGATCIPQPDNFHIEKFNGERVHVGSKIAFRMETKLEVMDDGYRWRKYGKKKVKSNPNPRNYYKCSTVGCSVKKTVQRDKDDSSYVITTYDGMHNH